MDIIEIDIDEVTSGKITAKMFTMKKEELCKLWDALDELENLGFAMILNSFTGNL